MKLVGLPQAKKAFVGMGERVHQAVVEATEEALLFIEAKAQENLRKDVYDKPRQPFAPALTGELFNSWVHELAELAGGVIGTITNTSGHAAFLEHGTDDAGTGKHWVGAVSAGALHWFNPATGESMFSSGHFVSGIVPLHFLENAVQDHRREIAAIYRAAVASAIIP